MALINLALVSQTQRVTPTEIKEVAAAVGRQLSRDLAPIWHVRASIDPFYRLEDVPPTYWPILVRDDLPDTGIIGMHLDRRHQPFALVNLSPTWSMTVSHEALEMVVDPWGNRLVPGGSPAQGQGLVEFLVEVCDPVGGIENSYTINGYPVSDFYTPHYFDPVASDSVRYSYTGQLARPRSLLQGGYVSWREPESQIWWQWDWVGRGPEPIFNEIGLLDNALPLREQIDRQGTLSELYTGAPPDHPKVLAASERYRSSRAASRAQALAVQQRYLELIGQQPPSGGPQASSQTPGPRTSRSRTSGLDLPRLPTPGWQIAGAKPDGLIKFTRDDDPGATGLE